MEVASVSSSQSSSFRNLSNDPRMELLRDALAFLTLPWVFRRSLAVWARCLAFSLRDKKLVCLPTVLVSKMESPSSSRYFFRRAIDSCGWAVDRSILQERRVNEKDAFLSPFSNRERTISCCMKKEPMGNHFKRDQVVAAVVPLAASGRFQCFSVWFPGKDKCLLSRMPLPKLLDCVERGRRRTIKVVGAVMSVNNKPLMVSYLAEEYLSIIVCTQFRCLP